VFCSQESLKLEFKLALIVKNILRGHICNRLA
jgi:hypothetical protein